MGLTEIPFTKNLAKTIETMQRHGLLLTSTDADGRPNVMTIGWGNPGVIWGRPIFIVLVRPSRFTFRNLEATGEFAVAVPTDDLHDACMYCGTVSGRDTDKFAGANLAAAQAKTVTAPLIQQCVRHYECKVVHYNDVSDAALAADVRSEAYPKGDLHRLYYGQILRATERT